MTNLTDKLAALSEAATQGEWLIHGAMLGYKGDIFSPTSKRVADCHHIARFYAPKPEKPVDCELQAIGVKREAVQQIEANASFIAALVEAYRTGQLIARPDRDAAIERMAQAIAPEVFACPRINLNKAAYDEVYEQATAAYDAMFIDIETPIH